MDFRIFSGSILLVLSAALCQINGQNLSISAHDITVIVQEAELVNIHLSGILEQSFNLTLHKQHDGLIELQPSVIEFLASNTVNVTRDQNVAIIGVSPGHLEVTADVFPNDSISVENIFMRITVANSHAIIYASVVVGWIYFAAWSVSFYPQIYINFRRKSVVGLNFDFIALNLVGFTMYGVFNMGLFWSEAIQDEYFTRYPRGLNPVLVNDVVFALHAFAATLITIGQCLSYERAEQRVSIIARSILGVFFVFIVVSAILAGTAVIHWLDFLYYCSYVKLTITLIKYVPQAVMNYRRKSTVGWSIGNILLDFTGGTLSMLQMILNAYNYDDWHSLFGDLTKFGLGLFSVLFDIFFMVQHYILYRNRSDYTPLDGENRSVSNLQNDESEEFYQSGPSIVE